MSTEYPPLEASLSCKLSNNKSRKKGKNNDPIDIGKTPTWDTNKTSLVKSEVHEGTPVSAIWQISDWNVLHKHPILCQEADCPVVVGEEEVPPVKVRFFFRKLIRRKELRKIAYLSLCAELILQYPEAKFTPRRFLVKVDRLKENFKFSRAEDIKTFLEFNREDDVKVLMEEFILLSTTEPCHLPFGMESGEENIIQEVQPAFMHWEICVRPLIYKRSVYSLEKSYECKSTLSSWSMGLVTIPKM